MDKNIRGMSIGLDMSTVGIERSLTAIKNSFREVKHAAKVNLNNIKFDTKSVDGYKRNLDQLNDAFKMQKRNVGELKRELDKLEETGKGNTNEAQRLRNEINKQTDEMNRLERAVESTTEELKKMELAQQGAKWTDAGKGITNFSDKLGKAGKSMKDVGGKMTAALTVPLAGIGTVAVKSAVDFEDSFAGVMKTVDMSDAGFEQLETSIRDMAKELPFAATEIAGVAESAGQLGIQNENIEGFTKTILDMGVATNLSTEQAATDFARFANIVQMPQENFDRLGSSVVELGNNLATTESEIVSMGMRLAGIGAQVGLSEAEIMALAAAMSSVGKHNCPVAEKLAA